MSLDVSFVFRTVLDREVSPERLTDKLFRNKGTSELKFRPAFVVCYHLRSNYNFMTVWLFVN